MDEKKVLEVLRSELKRWNSDQLHAALEFCDRKSRETCDGLWIYLHETVAQEITDREAGADA